MPTIVEITFQGKFAMRYCGALQVSRCCGNAEFVGWRIIDRVIKAEDD